MNGSSSSASVTSVAIAVLEHNDMFLTAVRPAAAVLGGLWEFPGGKVRPAESTAQAAVRECLEETGLEVVVTGRYGQQRQQYAHGVVQLSFLACELSDPARAEPREPWRWVARQDLAALEFPAGNARVLEVLQRNQPPDA